MHRLLVLIALLAVVSAPPVRAQQNSATDSSAQGMAAAREACRGDIGRLCAGVPSGGGRIIACLKQHKDEVSTACKRAVVSATSGSPADASAPIAPATVAPPPASAPPPAPVSAPRPTTSTATAAKPSRAGGERYYLMKQVKIIDQGLGNGRPAYDLMIPTTWDFKGAVNVGVAVGGCFADWFAVVGDAKSADGSIELQILPQFTWQYVDDPAARQYLQHQNQLAVKVGAKPCPVRAPVRAAEFLQQDILAKHRAGKPVISIEPFPELEQIVRHRLGLPPDAASGNQYGFRLDAARARLAFDDENGKPVEEWLAGCIVVHTLPGNGRGASYDWHAVSVLNLRTPKGQLDANDKLFKLIASTIRPEPEWRKWSNGVIANFYQKKAEEEAKQSAIIAAFQQQVLETINGVIANQQRGSYNSAVGASQLLRGVQTFRDPATGATFELSNQFDHAWLNGSNQYVMSDDPSFNPNGALSGSWNALQVVRPSP